MLFMRICSGLTAEEMAFLMGEKQIIKTGMMACSRREGVTDGLVCDADIYGVNEPAEYLKKWFTGCSQSEVLKAAKKILENVRGGYACALESNGSTYLFRDPVGLKPLYYKGEVFASEKKAFRGENPTPLLPGEVVTLPDTLLHRKRIEREPTEDPEILLEALRKSISQQIGKNAAILFSGGIDSALLASLSDASLITCGLEGSQDILFSRKASTLLKKECTELIISKKDIRDAVPKVLSIIEEKNMLNVEIGLLIFFVCQECDKDILISGQGADELFGGYYKYERAFHLKTDVKTFMKKDVDNIWWGLERDGQIAERFSKRIRYPFLDITVIEKALGIPAELLFEPQRKGFLRKVATLLELPEEIVFRPKKALQYGSGIHKVVKNLVIN